MIEDSRTDERIDDSEIESLLESMDRTAFRRRALIRAAAGQPVEEQYIDERTVPDFTAERLDRLREMLDGLRRNELRGGLLHKVADGIDLAVIGSLATADAPTPQELLHVYGPDRDGTGERKYYRYAWLDHGEFSSPFTTSAQTIIRTGKLAGSCGVYWGQWSFNVGGAGMLFIAEHGASRVSVRPYMPWLALTSFNHFAINASVKCFLGILVESWRPGGPVTQERDHFVLAVHRTSAEGYLFDSESSGTGIPSTGLQTDFVAVPGRRYGIYVYAWLETNGGAVGGGGPIGYSRIDIDASVPYVVAEETLL